ncbi:hypothetical protein BH10ACI4_BH10ACI4_33300 [soil metagenome]
MRRESLPLLRYAKDLVKENLNWIPRVRVEGYDAVIERVFVIHAATFDWNLSPTHNAPLHR